MSIYILILFAFIGFAFLTFSRKWHDYAMLFTIAIGCAVNANIYNGVSAPVYVGQICFSIDAILYTMFMFTVVICAKNYDIRRAKILVSAAIAAILVSAAIEFFATWSSVGYSTDLLTKVLGYVFSAIGTFVGVWIMLAVFKKLEEKHVNIYLSFVICVLIASVINTSIYYGGTIAVSGRIENLIYMLTGSFIAKSLSIILGEISYYVNTHFWIPVNLKTDLNEDKKLKTDSKEINKNPSSSLGNSSKDRK